MVRLVVIDLTLELVEQGVEPIDLPFEGGEAIVGDRDAQLAELDEALLEWMQELDAGNGKVAVRATGPGRHEYISISAVRCSGGGQHETVLRPRFNTDVNVTTELVAVVPRAGIGTGNDAIVFGTPFETASLESSRKFTNLPVSCSTMLPVA